MSKVFETGHAKNVAHFERLISYCEGYGPQYDPGTESLLLVNLTNLYNNAQKVLQETSAMKTQFNQATNHRVDVFQDYKVLATRIMNAFISSGASQMAIDDAKESNRKIQGKRAVPLSTKTTDPEKEKEKEDTSISVSQQSFDNIIKNYKALYQTVSAEPTYKPNEKDLSIDGLQKMISRMMSSNSVVIKATTDLENMRIKRNDVLYNEKNGLVKTAGNVKKYIKSVFGAGSEEVSQLNALEFTN